MSRASYTSPIRLMFRTFALLLCLSIGGAAVADESSLRGEFASALAEAETRGGSDADDSAALRAYLLYPYLQAARLTTALRRSAGPEVDAAVAAFLQQHGELPVSRELRRHWLLSLAEREQWAELLAADEPPSSDPALRCHRYSAWLATGGLSETERGELLALWTTGEQLPQACVAPFQWLQQQGLLTPERLEQRARLALEAGNADLADWLLRGVPEERAAPLRHASALLRNPRAELAVLAAQPALPMEWTALRTAWAKAARAKPEEVAPLLQPLIETRQLDGAQADELRRDLATGFALDRKPQAAIALYRRVPDARLDDRSREWRIRSALWQGDWTLAAEWLHQLPPTQAAEPRWTYWRARALEGLGRRHQAENLYETLMQDNGYYALLAAWRLQRKHTPQSQALVVDAAEQARLLAKPATLRARELFLVGRAELANAEWRLVLQGEEPLAQVQAARLAASWGWHLQTVILLNQLNLTRDLELLYPDAYGPEITAAARYAGIPPAWVYAVMRQESLFLPTAVSRSQALGLLQLLQPTAQQVARKWNRPRPSREDLLRPEINLPLGAAYLRDMTDRFGGRFILTLAAYNAGPNAVARWLPAQPVEADVWIENIPYNETRGYVQKILWHISAAAWRRSGEPQDVGPLLAPVGPATVEARACLSKATAECT